LYTIGVATKGIDYPDLAKVNCCCEGGGFGVARDEFNVLNATALDLLVIAVGEGD
jgi:hypothetical protein